MPELIVEVVAGMANRLRAMVSALCLAEDLQMPIRIIWSANSPACMAAFDTLFSQAFLPSWASVAMSPTPENTTEVLSPSDLELWLSKSQTPIRSYGHFYQKDSQRWLAWLRRIMPNPTIHIPLVTQQRVGVHIRRGDHEKSKRYSPLPAFIEAMQKEPSGTHFIVATDSMAERDALHILFGDRVTFPASSLSRMTQAGMNSAVADFIALSRCLKILGSYQSSFSELAALYGDIPLEVITVKN
jgi:hypothetical protein